MSWTLKKSFFITAVFLLVAIFTYIFFFSGVSNPKLDKDFNKSLNKKSLEIDHLDQMIVDMDNKVKIINDKMESLHKERKGQDLLLIILLVLGSLNLFLTFCGLFMKKGLKKAILNKEQK